MKFTVEREHLLKPLQQVSGPLGGRPTLPILGNLLLQVADGALSLTGTDLGNGDGGARGAGSAARSGRNDRSGTEIL